MIPEDLRQFDADLILHQSDEYWLDSYLPAYLPYYTNVLPSIRYYEAALETQGISKKALQHSFCDARICHYIHSLASLSTKSTLHKKGSLSCPTLGRNVIRSAERTFITIRDTISVKSEDLPYYSDLMGVEAGDIIVSEVSLDPEHLEMIDLRFDMPITVEAFIQCAPTLDALVTQEYLTLDELNTLRSQAVEGHVEPGTTRYFFVPAPMDPVEELSVASLRLG